MLLVDPCFVFEKENETMVLDTGCGQGEKPCGKKIPSTYRSYYVVARDVFGSLSCCVSVHGLKQKVCLMHVFKSETPYMLSKILHFKQYVLRKE